MVYDMVQNKVGKYYEFFKKGNYFELNEITPRGNLISEREEFDYEEGRERFISFNEGELIIELTCENGNWKHKISRDEGKIQTGEIDAGGVKKTIIKNVKSYKIFNKRKTAEKIIYKKLGEKVVYIPYTDYDLAFLREELGALRQGTDGREEEHYQKLKEHLNKIEKELRKK